MPPEVHLRPDRLRADAATAAGLAETLLGIALVDLWPTDGSLAVRDLDQFDRLRAAAARAARELGELAAACAAAAAHADSAEAAASAALRQVSR